MEKSKILSKQKEFNAETFKESLREFAVKSEKEIHENCHIGHTYPPQLLWRNGDRELITYPEASVKTIAMVGAEMKKYPDKAEEITMIAAEFIAECKDFGNILSRELSIEKAKAAFFQWLSMGLVQKLPEQPESLEPDLAASAADEMAVAIAKLSI